LPTTPLLAQHLRDGEHEVGCGCAFRQLARQLEADDFRDEHGDGLAQHGRFGLDAANAPAENGKAVDHGGVAVGADAGVGEGDDLAVFFLRPHGLGEVFEVHLVADACARRNDAEIVERGLAPFQELVALHVALVFARHVLAERFLLAEEVDHDRVVDDEIDGDERVDRLGVGAELRGGVAHGGKVDHGGGRR
jgi:hypothetical protein